MEVNKKQQLEKRTIDILEKTKRDKYKYETIRKKLYEFYKDGKDLLHWEEYINEIEKRNI